MSQKAIWEKKLFTITNKGSNSLKEYNEGKSIDLNVNEIQILNMLKYEYLPFYEMADSLNIDVKQAYNIVKSLSDNGYITNEL